ncbi:amidase family protein [Marinibaculum pumilum]|uniref:Amidase family protein n=1 Tax=Marinibaculum pumilum TaxID=1766165 RepID=A0ABV7L665_9PROT
MTSMTAGRPAPPDLPATVADPGRIAGLAAEQRSGGLTAAALVDSCLRRIAEVEDRVMAFRQLAEAAARVEAASCDAEAEAGHWRGRLHGIPVAIKDVLDVAGMPTRAGSPTRADAPPAGADAWIVGALRAAGAIVLGKAHTTEFAFFERPPPTRNPHALDHTPGGSSSGPAAAVAAGMAPVAVGTQTAGSVSRPAAFCGIGAFKPSTLALPGYGMLPFAPSFDTPGLYGYRLADAVAVFQAIAPPYLAPAPATEAPDEVPVVVLDDPLHEEAEPEVARALAQAAGVLSANGHRILRLAPPVPLGRILDAHRTVMEYELARVHEGLQTAPLDDVALALREAISRGGWIEAAGYRQAQAEIAAARQQLAAALPPGAVLLLPPAPTPAPPGMATGDPRFIIPFTALGGPIASFNVDRSPAGLPLGVMLAGLPGSDLAFARTACRLADLVERPPGAV